MKSFLASLLMLILWTPVLVFSEEPTSVGEEEGQIVGQATSVVVFQTFGGSHKDQSLILYVNLVGQTISELSDQPDLTYRFAVLNDSKSRAFSLPDGSIFVSVGLLKSLKNESELAGVLAHQIAHVGQKDYLKILCSTDILPDPCALSVEEMFMDPDLLPTVVGYLKNNIASQTTNPTMEKEADVLAVEYLYRVGYNLNGLSDAINKQIQSSSDSTVKKRLSQRISNLSKILTNYKNVGNLKVLEKRYQNKIKNL